MQKPGGLEDILNGMWNNVREGFEKIKNEANRSVEYLDKKLKGIGDKTYEKLRETKNKISEYIPIYIPIVGGAAITALPTYAKAPILAGLQIKNLYKDTKGKILGYGLIGIGIATVAGLGIMFLFNPIHSLPSNNEHVQYLGSQNGYQEFVPNGQTINYDGNTDPEGELILNNGTTIKDVIWDGQYAGTIIQNHDQIVQLNNQFVGQTDPINNQQYVPLQDFYVIKGQVPVQQVTINGQTYYVIEANNINPADIAGFYTYDNWVSNFVAAMNTPGTIPERLPGNSTVFTWTNTTGTVAYQTEVYGEYGPFPGGAVLVQSNRTIIPYGVNTNIPAGTYLSSFYAPKQVYNSSR